MGQVWRNIRITWTFSRTQLLFCGYGRILNSGCWGSETVLFSRVDILDQFCSNVHLLYDNMISLATFSPPCEDLRRRSLLWSNCLRATNSTTPAYFLWGDVNLNLGYSHRPPSCPVEGLRASPVPRQEDGVGFIGANNV